MPDAAAPDENVQMIRYSYNGVEICVPMSMPWEEWMKMRNRIDDAENIMILMAQSETHDA
jgi:hypothetical protein